MLLPHKTVIVIVLSNMHMGLWLDYTINFLYEFESCVTHSAGGLSTVFEK
jgi:hypothetical protein